MGVFVIFAFNYPPNVLTELPNDYFHLPIYIVYLERIKRESNLLIFKNILKNQVYSKEKVF